LINENALIGVNERQTAGADYHGVCPVDRWWRDAMRSTSDDTVYGEEELGGAHIVDVSRIFQAGCAVPAAAGACMGLLLEVSEPCGIASEQGTAISKIARRFHFSGITYVVKFQEV
jgi:hypothetical protein